MTFVWDLEDGSRLAGKAEGVYEVSGSIKLEAPQMRVITFDLESEADASVRSRRSACSIWQSGRLSERPRTLTGRHCPFFIW